jgi:hypothetical protein
MDIKERLAQLRQQHKKSAPSFNPSPKRPETPRSWKAPKVEPILPDASELITDSHELDTLRSLVALHVTYSAEERRAKHEKKPVVESLKSICNDYGLSKITCDRNKVSYYPLSKSSINRQLLLDAGVSSEIIDRCTITTASFGVRVTPPGASDEDDTEE